MAQIQAGTAYVDGAQVTAANLNAHVNNAVLVPGAISDQAAATSVADSDSVLVLQSGTLKKASVSQLSPNAPNYILRDGSVSMTGELTLSNSLPTAALSAASKGYVDTKQPLLGYTPVNKAGDTMTGALVLPSNAPVNPLDAAPKQYVDTKQAALGYTPVNKAGDTMTGALVLSGSPASNLEAAPKQYVDTQIATRIPTGGATVAGTYLFSGKLQTSTAPTQANDVVNKSYLDTFVSSIPQLAASAYFYTAIQPATTASTSTFLSVTASRSAGSSTLTISYGNLAARYYDPAKPFFLAQQYIGINTVSGITARIYKITSSNLAARTFTVTTPETTAFSGTISLSLIYDSTNLTGGMYGYNVKSIYLDIGAKSKAYVNYIKDLITGESAPAFPTNTQIDCIQVSGDGYGYNADTMMAKPMRDIGRTTYIYSQDVAEGVGSNSLGCHIGFFYNNAGGADYTAYYGASFLITAQLPPA